MSRAHDPALRRVSLLVALSGATGLVYESLWMRCFGVIFGNTTDAVAVILATFMGGLALGGLAVARRRTLSPLRAYGRLEIGIGATALATLPLLKALPWLYAELAARGSLQGSSEAIGRGVAAALVVLPPTILLGATVPLVVEFLVRSGREFHGSLGRLYLVNTLGGAAGVVVGAFGLVPNLGLTFSFVATAAVNLCIGATATRWSREQAPAEVADSPSALASEATPFPLLFMALAAASGVFTFAIEVLWTRSLVLVIGSSVYAFNLILLAVLLGIAAGTALYPRLGGRQSPERMLGLLFVGSGLMALAGVGVIGWLPEIYLALITALPVSFVVHQAAALSMCLVALVPVTILLGMSFPLLAHLAERNSAQRISGLLYAWNTAGAIVGALAADLFLVRRFGLQRSYLILAAVPLIAGGAALGRGGSRAARVAAPAAAALLTVALWPFWRPWDPLLMTAGVYKYGLEWRTQPGFSLRQFAGERRLLFYEEGAEAVVAVAERPGSGRRFLSVNGKTDAGSGAEDVLTQKFIAHVPLLLHPAPRRALVIGWGAGATAASAALYPLEALECVEIEPATWRAAPLFASLNGRLQGDRRFAIVFADGRNHLLRARERYDVVVSEPSNPWISGVSNLFTLEFYETVRARLAPGGVFGQWFHYYNFEPQDVKVELKTFAQVFPHVSVWLVPPIATPDGSQLTADLLMVGSADPHNLEWTRLERAMSGPVGEDLRQTGVVGDAAALLAAWTLGRPELQKYVEDPQRFPRGTPVNSDDQPWIEFSAPRRNVLPPTAVASMARAQYEALGEAAGVEPPVTGMPDKAAVFQRLAQRYVEAALPGRALRALERSLSLDPASASAHMRLAELLLEHRRPDEAEPQLREAVGLDPFMERAWELLGGLYTDRRDYRRAEDANREILRRRPRKVDAWLRLGAVLARQGRWVEAREALRSGRALDPAAPVDPALLEFIERQAAGR